MKKLISVFMATTLLAITFAAGAAFAACKDDENTAPPDGGYQTEEPNDAPSDDAAELMGIKPGERWYDTDGKRIQAHGGQVQLLTYEDRDGKTVTKFWWVGEDKGGMTNYITQTNNGVHAYSSSDLINWTDEGTILRSANSREELEDEYFASLYRTEEEKEKFYLYNNTTGGIQERPKMIYNELTDKYILWYHSDYYDFFDNDTRNYRTAQASVAVADHPWGPFRFVDSFRMYYDGEYNGGAHYADPKEQGTVRDMNVLVDGDKAYLVYTSNWNSVMYVGLLDETFTKPATGLTEFCYVNDNNEEVVTKIADMSRAIRGEHYTTIRIDNQSREAPALAKADGKYYMLSSDCNAWTPSTTLSYTCNDMLGEWVNEGDAFKDDADHNSFRSQSTCIVWTGKQWMYMGDRWDNSGGEYLNTQDSRYVWLPITITADKKIQIEWRDSWVPETDLGEYGEKPAAYDNIVECEVSLDPAARREYILYEQLDLTGIDLVYGDKVMPASACRITGNADEAGGRTITLQYTEGETLYQGSYEIDVFDVVNVAIISQPQKVLYAKDERYIDPTGLEVWTELDREPSDKRFVKPDKNNANTVKLTYRQYWFPDICYKAAGVYRIIVRCGNKYDFLYYAVEGTVITNNAPSCYGVGEEPDLSGITAESYSRENVSEDNIFGKTATEVEFGEADMSTAGMKTLNCYAGGETFGYIFNVYNEAVKLNTITPDSEIYMYYAEGDSADNDGTGIFKVKYYSRSADRYVYEINTWGNYRDNTWAGHIVFWTYNGAVDYSKILYDQNGYQYNENTPVYLEDSGDGTFTFNYKCGDGTEITACGYKRDLYTIRYANTDLGDSVLNFEGPEGGNETLTLYITARYEMNGRTYARGYYEYVSGNESSIYTFDYYLEGWSSHFSNAGVSEEIVTDTASELHDWLKVTVGDSEFYADDGLWHHVVIGWAL